ncbi:extracellular solute-binding protein [Microbacterium radiodurans]|uniref:Extracellular solute-binding protein n=1 Tax=Microbacterium radiodurans TaxID=661398 RepID=A0A5J5IXL3_9MICO|nr:extracellular solute-binding protein [Microbacterium radiodurans]KAA9089542.1 extracellular solute-binding protein [Microbacterium radiodurans]
MAPPLELSRRRFLTGAAALAGTAFLASCAATPGGAGANARTLQFWHLLSGADGVTMSGLLDAVNGAQNDYRIRPTVLAWGEPYYTKLAMAAAGGRAPDVSIMHASRVVGYAPGGLLDTWDTGRLAELGVSADNFPDAVWNKGFIGDDLYSIALDAHPFILMYNTDICGEAGVLDADGKLLPVGSPDEFLELVRSVAAVSQSHGLSYGYLGDGAQMWRLFYTLYTQHGIEMELPQGGPAEIDDDAALASLTFMQQLLDDELAARSADYQSAIAEFATGRSGLFLTGVWELRSMQQAGLPIDATIIPTLFGTPSVYADSHAFTLPHQSAPDEASRDLVYRFVADILKGSFDWAEAGHIPAYLPVTQSPAYAELLPQAHYAEAAELVRYDPPAWFTGSGSRFQADFGAAVQNVLLQGADPAAALSRFRARIDQQLQTPNPADPDGSAGGAA